MLHHRTKPSLTGSAGDRPMRQCSAVTRSRKWTFRPAVHRRRRRTEPGHRQTDRRYNAALTLITFSLIVTDTSAGFCSPRPDAAQSSQKKQILDPSRYYCITVQRQNDSQCMCNFCVGRRTERIYVYIYNKHSHHISCVSVNYYTLCRIALLLLDGCKLGESINSNDNER